MSKRYGIEAGELVDYEGDGVIARMSRMDQGAVQELIRRGNSAAALLAAAKAALEWIDDNPDCLHGIPPDIKDQLRAAIAAAETGT